ncbi:MAG: hypothetical protein EOO47_04415 [Flavobacterium sp.]|nr:MAG: hypothetical protein EOO47_04415 [Flavobacterium sp.]
MNNKIFFTERQKFRQWWLGLILLAINVLFLFGIYKQVIGKEQFGNNPMSNTGLLISAGITLLLTFVMLNFRLDTLIKDDGIYVRFFPFHLSFKYYSWQSLTKTYVRTYSPIAEYGGWGLRMGLFGKGMAYNVSGNKGLQLEFSNGKKLLIGTNKPEEITAILINIERLTP